MRVAMFTNTYLPLLGGVERSVATTAAALQRLGHACLVVTPHDRRAGAAEPHTVRVPALNAIAGTAFSYRLPGAGELRKRLQEFVPDLVHAHHPFMLGDTGVRLARGRGVPVVFTCHTRWERFVPAGWPLLRRLARQLPVAFAGLCDLVIAPTPSIARLLRRRGVETPIAVVPTGIDVASFAAGRRERGRARWGIGAEETVIGHVGRLVPEKNLGYLTSAALAFLQGRECPRHEALRDEALRHEGLRHETPQHEGRRHEGRRHGARRHGGPRHPGRFLLVGEGRSEGEVARRFAEAGLDECLVRTGRLDGEALADAYAAMDVFAFTACTDTQGLVLAEAAAAGCPIVALDAPGPRDFVDGRNGILVPLTAPAEAFAAAIAEALEPLRHAAMRAAARHTALDYDLAVCTRRLVEAYEGLGERHLSVRVDAASVLRRIWWRALAEWDLLGQKAALARVVLR